MRGIGITVFSPVAGCAIGLLFATVHASAGEVILFPVADTVLSQNWAPNNFGGMPFAMSGTTQNFTRNRALFRFDPGALIPAGAVVSSAALWLEVTREPADGYNVSDFGLHRMLRSWGEGDNITPSDAPSPASGAPADAGEANWLYRHAGSELWGAPGGQPGTDYSEVASASTSIYGTGDSPYLFVSTQMARDVQLWLNDPDSNFGWMLISQSETLDFTARRVGTREDPLNRPYLTIQFELVPEPSAFCLLALGVAGWLRRLR